MKLSLTVAATLLLVASAANTQALHDHESIWTPEFPLPTHTRAAKTHTTIPLFGNISSPNLFNFYGEVSIGTPPQKFKLFFDTRALHVIIPNFKAPTSQHAFYDHNKSSSYEADGIGISSVGGWFSFNGFFSRDTIHIGDLPVSNASLIETREVMDPPNFADLDVDGVFGLGPGRGPDLRFVSALQRLVGSGALEEPVFTLYFNKNKKIGGALAADADEPTSAGELTIGAIDKRHYTGDIHYVNTLVDPDYMPDWKVALDAVTVSRRNVENDKNSENFIEPGSASAVARIMTAWPFIAGPKNVIERLAKAVGADGDMIDCSSNGPSIVFHIGGVKHTLTKDDYTLRDEDDSDANQGEGSCRWAFVVLSEEDLWLIGQPFLQKFYTVFEFGDEQSNTAPRIGFALAT